MSDHITFEIQEEIMKKLPVNSLVRFRSVSKQWKSLIDSSKFIKNYHINRTHPQHHLLVQSNVNYDGRQKYISIIDDNTFPNHKFSVTSHQLQDFYRQYIVGSSQGIICIFCSNKYIKDKAVLWNPAVRKTVGVVIPHVSGLEFGTIMLSFGVCPSTSDPKIVQVIVNKIPTIKWDAKVFTLSSQVWKTVTVPSTVFNNHDLGYGNVSTQGFIYFLARDTGISSNLIVSFDLGSEEFGKVYLPDSLLHSKFLGISKRNECLTLLENCNVDDVHVWMMNDSVTKSFTKIFTLKSLGPFGWRTVLGFRKNGKAIIRTDNVDVDGDANLSSLVEVYDPCSGGINDIGINGIYGSFQVSSYMETLLLFDQADSDDNDDEEIGYLDY